LWKLIKNHMKIAVIILAYILYLDDILNIMMGKNSNILVSGSLITLLSWHISTPWGDYNVCNKFNNYNYCTNK